MLNLMIAAALAATTAHAPSAIRNHDVDPRVLDAALRAPESARRAGEGPRYCVVRGDEADGRARKLCRTRREWVDLGVVPVRS